MKIPTYQNGKPSNLQAAIIDAEYWLRWLRSQLNNQTPVSDWSEHLADLRRAIGTLHKFLPPVPENGTKAKAHGTAKEAVYSYVTEYLERVGHSPTLAEIAAGVGLKPPTVHYHLESLETEERIERRPGSPRGIKVL